MKLWIIAAILSFASASAEEAQLYRGLSAAGNWPHRYILEVQGEKVSVHVEQQIPQDAVWFSWGDEVKVVNLEEGKLSFVCPWGVIGKALPVTCVLKFDKILAEGFDATLTVESFEDNKTVALRFTKVSRKHLAQSIADLANDEAKQEVAK